MGRFDRDYVGRRDNRIGSWPTHDSLGVRPFLRRVAHVGLFRFHRGSDPDRSDEHCPFRNQCVGREAVLVSPRGAENACEEWTKPIFQTDGRLGRREAPNMARHRTDGI